MVLEIIGGVTGLLLLLLLAAWTYDTVRRWREARGIDHVVLGQPFSLAEGRRAELDGLLLRLDPAPGEPSRIRVDGIGESRILGASDLPAILSLVDDRRYELRSLTMGPPARFLAVRWHGIRLRTSAGEISWRNGTEQQAGPKHTPSVEEEPPPARSGPRIPIRGEYAFETKLVPAGMRAQGFVLDKDILILIHFPGGEVASHSLEYLRRAAFTASTGVHPSWADFKEEPVKDGPVGPGQIRQPLPADVAGIFTADIGIVLAPPAVAHALTIVAACGPYRSNEIRIVIRP